MTAGRPFSKQLWWLVLSLCCAMSMGWFVLRIWAFNQLSQFNDLYAPWWGTHELLLHGRNPYSPAVAHEIQAVIYGSPLPSTPEDPSGIGGGFAYPLHVAFLLWPLVYLSFPLARLVVLFASLLGTLASLECWLRSFHIRLTATRWLTLAFFVVGSFPCMQGLKLTNLSLIAAALISIGVFLLSIGRFVPAGMVLAIATFKPQFVIALIPWLVLWALADWRRRRSFFWCFVLTLFLLLAASEVLLPDWPRDFLTVIRAYPHYTYGHSVLDVWFGSPAGTVVAAALLAVCAILFWRQRLSPAESPAFLLTTSLALTANVVVIPTLAPHAQLLLIPGFLYLLFYSGPHKNVSPWSRILTAAAWILLAWPWIAAAALAVTHFRYPTPLLHRYWELPLYTSPVTPVALLLALSSVMVFDPRRGPPSPTR